MRGVVLAGGTGSRLNPLTRVTNKHLLPVYDKPMVYYPIQTLVNAGIEEILLVTGGKNAGDFLRLLGNGRDFGLKHINYTYQEGEGGIAQALGLAEYFAGNDSICVILGDNIIETNVCQAVQNFKKQKDGAKILLKEVPDAQRFGVAELRGNHVIGIEEKPGNPKSNYAVIGIYLYDKTVFEKIHRLKPSGRGELEITDVNNFYVEEGKLTDEAMRGCDAVIHFAAESHVDRSIYEPAPVIETNVTGTFIQGRFGSSVHRRPARVRVARTSQPIFAWARPLLVSGRACCFPQRLTIKSIFPLGSREASSR